MLYGARAMTSGAEQCGHSTHMVVEEYSPTALLPNRYQLTWTGYESTQRTGCESGKRATADAPGTVRLTALDA